MPTFHQTQGFHRITMPSDADYTMTELDGQFTVLRITSAVTLTGTRNVFAPLFKNVNGEFVFPSFLVDNQTTGGQSIVFIGLSGTGVTILNGANATVFTDGTNYNS